MCVCVCMRMCTHCDSSYLEVGVCLRACVCVCVHMCTHCDSSYLVVGVCVCSYAYTLLYIAFVFRQFLASCFMELLMSFYKMYCM